MSILSYSDHDGFEFGHPLELFHVWISRLAVTNHGTIGELFSPPSSQDSHLWNGSNNFLEKFFWGWMRW